MRVYSCVYMLMSVKSCMHLFAYSKVRIQLCVQVYGYVFMLMSIKSCKHPFAHAKVRTKTYMRVYSCVFMLMSVKSCIHLYGHVKLRIQSCLCEYMTVLTCSYLSKIVPGNSTSPSKKMNNFVIISSRIFQLTSAEAFNNTVVLVCSKIFYVYPSFLGDVAVVEIQNHN